MHYSFGFLSCSWYTLCVSNCVVFWSDCIINILANILQHFFPHYTAKFSLLLLFRKKSRQISIEWQFSKWKKKIFNEFVETLHAQFSITTFFDYSECDRDRRVTNTIVYVCAGASSMWLAFPIPIYTYSFLCFFFFNFHSFAVSGTCVEVCGCHRCYCLTRFVCAILSSNAFPEPVFFSFFPSLSLSLHFICLATDWPQHQATVTT